MRGKFIVIEGIDGCGKTTQIEKIAKWLPTSGLMKKNSVEGHGEVVPEEFGKSGSLDLQFSQMGETIGKSVDTPIDQLDKEEKVINLNVKYEQTQSGCYKVYGSLV